MARLDESTLLTATPAQHLSDHNQLHSKANYVFDVKDYGALGDGTTDDTAAIQAAIDAAEAATYFGEVYFPGGWYMITSGLTVNKRGITLVGDGRETAIFAQASITYMVTFLVPSGRGHQGGIRNISIRGASGLTTGGVLVDSWVAFRAEHVLFEDISDRCITFTASNDWTENCVVTQCSSRLGSDPVTPDGFVTVESGTSKSCTEVTIDDCMIIGLSGWGVILDDVARCTVRNFVAAASVDFSGGVHIYADNDAVGSPTESGRHMIDNIYIENNAAAGSAICVKIESGANATKFVRDNIVMATTVEPQSRSHLVLVNGAAGIEVQHNTFLWTRQVMASAGNVTIGANCAATNIFVSGENAQLDTSITDNGVSTLINGHKSQAAGNGNTPGGSYHDVGQFIRNSSDGTLWYIDVGGTIRRILTGDATYNGFYGATTVAKPTVTGARDDGTALADLLTELDTLGLIADSSTAT